MGILLLEGKEKVNRQKNLLRKEKIAAEKKRSACFSFAKSHAESGFARIFSVFGNRMAIPSIHKLQHFNLQHPVTLKTIATILNL